MANSVAGLRRDTKANWEANNPIVLDGEQIIVSDTREVFTGDGSSYNSSKTKEGEFVPDGHIGDGYDSTGPTLIVPDTLRASVEAATGGRMTVLYDDQGYPSYMVRIPAFNREDIHSDFGTGRHPAFTVGGTDKAEIFVAAHQGYVHNNRALSLPGLDPTVNLDWDQAHTYCENKGSGWHLMTNWEWAAVVLWVMKQVTDSILPHQPRGNTDHGRAHDEYQEVGTRQDGTSYVPGNTSGSGRILTGSGPETWRHDLTVAGIADMVGNIWELVGGLKIIDGAIKMPNDNDYTMSDSSYPDQDATISDSNPWNNDGVTVGGSGDAALLMSALLKPASAVTNTTNGRLYVNETDERVPRRGGHWNDGSNAGLAALYLYNTRSFSLSSLGFRPCYIA